MPARPPAETADTRSLPGRNLLLVLLVAPLAAVIWWFSPSTSSPAPMGRAEESLRAQANDLLQLQGHSAAHQPCEYWVKHLYLTCSVAPNEMVRIADSFTKAGWSEAKGHAPPQGELAYVRDKETARVTCSDPGPKQDCLLYLYYPR